MCWLFFVICKVNFIVLEVVTQTASFVVELGDIWSSSWTKFSLFFPYSWFIWVNNSPVDYFNSFGIDELKRSGLKLVMFFCICFFECLICIVFFLYPDHYGHPGLLVLVFHFHCNWRFPAGGEQIWFLRSHRCTSRNPQSCTVVQNSLSL